MDDETGQLGLIPGENISPAVGSALGEGLSGANWVPVEDVEVAFPHHFPANRTHPLPALVFADLLNLLKTSQMYKGSARLTTCCFAVSHYCLLSAAWACPREGAHCLP